MTDRTQHYHNISAKTRTASVVDPDLTPYAKSADVAAGDKVNADAIAALTLRVAALEAAPPPAPIPPSVSAVYGPAIGMDGIGNTQIGGPNGSPTRHVAYRFRASSSSLTSIQFTQTNGAGYWGGTGGTLEIAVESDDGSGHPSGTILASKSFTPTNIAGYWPVLTWTSPVALTPGALYHIVFWNTDANPATNYPSLNNHYMAALESPRCPRFPDTDWAEIISENGMSGWYDPRPDTTGVFIPQLALFYADSTIQGVCYPYVRPSYTISGGIREMFTPSANRTVSRVGLRLSGTASVRLETSAGVEIETVALVASAGAWVSAAFATSHVLTAGQAYHLLVTGSGTVKSLYKGTGYGSWPAATGFADGHAQSGSWTDHTDQDLPFYFA